MIVTRAGRRMFPLLSIGISGLEPSAEYSLLLELRPMDECRWKFCNGRWTFAAAADMLNRKEQQRSVHVHHSSPSGGSKWMSASGVVFAKVKLSNKEDTCPSEKLVLRSMHKYQPYVHIVRLPSDERETVRIFTFAFAETQFVAVTAYQNDKITQMKIKHNPFAKAFLESQVRDQSGEEGNEDTCTPLPKQQTSPQTQPSLHHDTQAEYSPDSSSLSFHSCMHSLHSNTPLSHSNYLHQNGSQVLSHLNYPLYSPRHHLHQQQDGAFTGPGVNMLHWVPIPQASVLNNSGRSLYIL